MSRLAKKIKDAGTPYATIFGPIHRLDLTPDEFATVKAAPDMLKALMEVSVFAQMQVDDICADIQAGGLDEISRMELARWQSVGSAIAKATGA